jgi:hypothetical protein
MSQSEVWDAAKPASIIGVDAALTARRLGMLQIQHIGVDAANVAIEQVIAYAANAAIDANAAMQSGMLQIWQRQSRCDAKAAIWPPL